jgi:glutaredoxin
MDKLLILFTMEGCPFCVMMKDKLTENNIEYFERDIDKYNDEYEMFVEITQNEMVPAFMVVENPDKNPKSHLYAPEYNFDSIDEGIGIIKEHFGK